MANNLNTKYRPKTFDEVVGQEYVIKILKKQVETKTIKNGYLFCGSSGCGKTTVARIYANEVNHGNGNPIEFDAASNSGVDNVRSIIDSSTSRSITGEYKVFIIDECHSLSNQAWQAFLKTLEEPSDKTIFIFCTTEVQKVPVTIINRLQRFDFGKVEANKIVERLSYICNKENFQYELGALEFIAKVSEGRMRDSITNLDKIVSYSNVVNMTNAFNVLNVVDYKSMFDLVNSIIDRKTIDVLSFLTKIDIMGKEIKQFLNELTNFVLDINKFIVTKDFSYVTIPSVYEKELTYTINFEGSDKFFSYLLKELITLKNDCKNELNAKPMVESTLFFLSK